MRDAPLMLLLGCISMLWLGVLTLAVMEPVLVKPVLLRTTVFVATAFAILLVMLLMIVPYAAWDKTDLVLFVSMLAISFIGAGLGFLFHKNHLPSPRISALLGGVFATLSLSVFAMPLLFIILYELELWSVAFLVGSALVALVGGFWVADE